MTCWRTFPKSASCCSSTWFSVNLQLLLQGTHINLLGGQLYSFASAKRHCWRQLPASSLVRTNSVSKSLFLAEIEILASKQPWVMKPTRPIEPLSSWLQQHPSNSSNLCSCTCWEQRSKRITPSRHYEACQNGVERYNSCLVEFKLTETLLAKQISRLWKSRVLELKTLTHNGAFSMNGPSGISMSLREVGWWSFGEAHLLPNTSKSSVIISDLDHLLNPNSLSNKMGAKGSFHL